MRVVKPFLGSLAMVLALVGFPGPASAAAPGNQSVTIVIKQDFTLPQPIFSRVVATGVITAVGTDVFLPSPEGDPASYSRHEFRDGTLSVRNTPQQEDFTLDPRSCVGSIKASGTWEVLGGTGAYAGAQGSGMLTVSGQLLVAREAGGCSDTHGMFIGTVKITGQVTLPTAAG